MQKKPLQNIKQKEQQKNPTSICAQFFCFPAYKQFGLELRLPFPPHPFPTDLHKSWLQESPGEYVSPAGASVCCTTTSLFTLLLKEVL